jgi:phosphohistidine phosphatase
MKKAAHGLHSLVPWIELLVSSPLRRALQTADIIAQVYGNIRCIERDELSPGADPRRLIDWLARRHREGIACVVGHKPDLSGLLTVLLSDESEVPPKLKKGSASFVSFSGPIAVSSGRLTWHRSARELAS